MSFRGIEGKKGSIRSDLVYWRNRYTNILQFFPEFILFLRIWVCFTYNNNVYSVLINHFLTFKDFLKSFSNTFLKRKEGGNFMLRELKY